MLAYKYSFDDVMERPLLTVPLQGGGKRSVLATFIILPILIVIGIVLLVFSPVKMVQLILEKLEDRRPVVARLNERND